MPPVPFHEFLRDLRSGVATEEWADEMAKVLEAVKATSRKGTLTIKIEFAPKGRTVVVSDSVEGKLPRFDAEAAVFFIDDSLSLVRNDPSQGQFFDNNADRVTGEIGDND